MKTILYTQNESPTIKNTIMVNGEIFQDFDEEKAQNAYHFIIRKAENRGSYEWLIKCLIYKGVIKSPKFKFIKESSGILIKSCFNETDVMGRHLPFLFYTTEKNMAKVQMVLQQYAKQVNRTYQADELINLGKALKVVMYGGLTLGIIFIILFIWKI